MSRRRRAQERKILPDPKFKSDLVAKFINGLMLEAMENSAPVLEVKSRRVGGATYQVPVEVREKRRRTLSIRWLVLYSRSRSERTMAEKLANELMAAAKGEGGTIKKKDDTHRMAEANKAFAHFRW